MGTSAQLDCNCIILKYHETFFVILCFPIEGVDKKDKTKQTFFIRGAEHTSKVCPSIWVCSQKSTIIKIYSQVKTSFLDSHLHLPPYLQVSLEKASTYKL